MEIKRDGYLEQLKMRRDNGMIKIITGIRRCGKSYLLFVLFKKYLLENGIDRQHIIEIALDGIEKEELRDPKLCYQFIKKQWMMTENIICFRMENIVYNELFVVNQGGKRYYIQLYVFLKTGCHSYKL